MDNNSGLIANLKRGKEIMDEIQMKEDHINSDTGGCFKTIIFCVIAGLL